MQQRPALRILPGLRMTSSHSTHGCAASALASIAAALALVLVAPAATGAQQTSTPLQDGQTIRLWAGAAPGALGTDDSDIPSLTVFLPRDVRPNTPAVIIAPGGGYVRLAANHEGRQVASFLNSLGLAAFVLRYRLGPRYHHPIELGDAQRAIRLLRAHAADWMLDPSRIGILGFSAGGHLAMTASTRGDGGQAGASDPVDRASSRPDFTVLGYPVISLSQPWTHQGSKTALLGNNPDPALVARLSGEQAVTANTPPTFLFHTNSDTAVPAENSVHYYLALRRAGVPAEMHIFERGPHGVGLANDDPALSEWSTLLANWLRGRGVLRP
jgi:acetyl esterase/lipase